MPSLIAPNYHVYLAVILTTQSPCYPPDVQQAVFTDEQGRSCPADRSAPDTLLTAPSRPSRLLPSSDPGKRPRNVRHWLG